MKRYFKAIMVSAMLAFSVLRISEISSEVNSSVSRCLNVIIPSLFITMAISDYIISTRCFDYISHTFRPIARILGLDEKLVPVLIISNVGGYPIGIRMLGGYVKRKELTEKQAGIIASYCFCSGPAFTIGTIGVCVYNNNRIGAAVYASIIIANLLTAMIINRLFGINKIKLESQVMSESIESKIISSVEAASKALFSMCSVIIAFSIVIVAVNEFLVFMNISEKSIIGVIIRSIVDVTNIVNINGNNSVILPVVTFVISLGGLCVWAQCIKLNNKRIDLIRCFLLRIVVSVLSAVVFYTLFSEICKDFVSANVRNPHIIVNIDNFVPSFCLIIMIFLFFLKKRLAFNKKV